MSKKVSKLFTIYKTTTDKIMEDKLVITDVNYESGELVNISNNQVFHKIQDYYKSTDKKNITDNIIDVVVPPNVGRSKQKERDYESIAKSGFTFNGKPYKRLCSGSGQIRSNTITFVHDKLYNYLFESLCCGLTSDDFGNDFNTAKFNAYFGLNMSGVNFLQTPPRVCVIDDYEKIFPHQEVDYIVTETKEVQGAKRKGTIVSKNIIRCNYDEDKHDAKGNFIEEKKPLNSFDGQGLMSTEYAKKIAIELGYLKSAVNEETGEVEETGYIPSEVIIRAPWCKGLLVNFDWKEYCKRNKVTKLKDIFGTTMNINNIDILMSKSQFKMWKIYAKKGGWKYYIESMKKYNLKWGIVLPNKQFDDKYKAINYQYINPLIGLSDSDIDNLCQRSIDKLTKLCNGDIEEVFNTLVSINDNSDEICEGEELEEVSKPYESLLEKAIKANSKLLQDTYIQKLIFNECKAKFRNAKIGKVLCRGNYQYMVSDPVAQIQHIINAHAVNGNKEIKVTGLIPAYSVFSRYWNRQAEKPNDIVLMRSPLIDQSEVAVRTLLKTNEAAFWYKTITSGIIFSIHDLTALQCQGADFDGDRIFNSIESTLKSGAINNPIPLLYPAATTQVLGAITEDNLIDADIRGLNSKVGKYSNKSTSFYAKLVRYDEDSEEYRNLLKYIKVLGETVGTEIDSVKTGIKPKLPSEWKTKIIPKKVSDKKVNGKDVYVDDCTKEEKEEIFKHNALVSDIRPYYMRYNYNYLDRKTTSTKKSFNYESYYNYGLSIDALMKLDELDEKQKRTVTKYMNWNPVIDSNCVMNKVCHKFETLEKELKKHKGSTNILKQYIGSTVFDEETSNKVQALHTLYKNHNQAKTKYNNSGNNNHSKVISKETKKETEKILCHIRRKLIEICGDNVQSIYDYCMKYCDANFTWKVLDELILQVISQKTVIVKPSEYFSIDCSDDYSVNDESIFAEVETIKKQRELPECELPLLIYKEELDEIAKLNSNTLEELAFIHLVYSKMYPYKWLYKCDSLLFAMADNNSNGTRRKKLLFQLSNNNIIEILAQKEKDKSKPIPVPTKFQVLCKKADGEVILKIYNPNNAVMYYRGYKGIANTCAMCGCIINKTNNKAKYCADCAKQVKLKQNKKYREENRKNVHTTKTIDI